MKRFKDFINEEKTEPKDSLEQFLKDVIGAIKHDFNHPTGYGEAFIQDHEEELQSAWENGLTVREAIASTKRPGVIIDNNIVAESYVFEIDNDYEESYKKLENMTSKNHLYKGRRVVKDYFKKYEKKSFSDIRIFERVKNNYNSLIKKYEEKRSKLNG